MSLSSKLFVTVATALASNQVRNLLSEIELEDVLTPLGLARRRTHWGSSFVLLGVGVVVGGGVTFLLGSPSAAALRERIQERLRTREAPEERPKEEGSSNEGRVPGSSPSAESDNSQPRVPLGPS